MFEAGDKVRLREGVLAGGVYNELTLDEEEIELFEDFGFATVNHVDRDDVCINGHWIGFDAIEHYSDIKEDTEEEVKGVARCKLEYLLKKQKELDDKIILGMADRYEKVDRTELTHNKVTALMVETAELANELKYFKHWSTKSANVGKAREEYIDVLHFVLSLGNDFFETPEEIIEAYDKKNDTNHTRQKEGY